MTDDKLTALRHRATRPRRTVPLVLDGELRDQIEDLVAAADRPAGDRRLTSRPAADPRLADLRAQAAQSTVHVVLEGLPGTLWRAFMAEHPPRRDDAGRVVADDMLGMNEETFRLPLVRACIVGHRPEPDAPVEPVDDDFADWLLGFVTDVQMDRLVSAALYVCRGDDPIPLLLPPFATPPSDDA